MINFVIQNDWKWNHCRLPIKKSQRHSKRRDQQYFYQVINSQDTGPINEDKIRLTLDRLFPFQNDTGFVWHKSWNLPQLTININENELSYLRQHYKQIKCQIMAVYPIKYSNSYYLNQITLQGTCLKTMHENSIVFKFLKFGETSFNHNRNKFCLLVWIYGQNAYKDKDDVFCLISSPIYVDSRKQARKKQANNSNNSLIHSPNKFNASIKGIKGSISNSSQGFIGYYGAQNIRNKIKHPFYIAYHFDKIFKLYLNIELNISASQAINQIQSTKIIEGTVVSQQNNIILLQVIDQNQKNRKKIISIIQKWKFGLIFYWYQGGQVNLAKWRPIQKQQIRSSYRAYYENQLLKQQQVIYRRQQQNSQNIGKNNIKNGESDQKSAQLQKNKYELRTIIELSKPKKKVKIEQQQ